MIIFLDKEIIYTIGHLLEDVYEITNNSTYITKDFKNKFTNYLIGQKDDLIENFVLEYRHLFICYNNLRQIVDKRLSKAE